MAVTVLTLLDLARRKQALLHRKLARPKQPPVIEANDVQGLVFRGYGGLKHCRYELLRFKQPAQTRRWLAELLPQVTPGASGSRDTAVHVAFTYAGLQHLGLPDTTLAGFSQPFIEGMATPHRSRLFGDTDKSAPEHWLWGGPTTAVHAVVILYASSAGRLLELQTKHGQAQTNAGFETVFSLLCSPSTDKEHFGFADGVSQPAIEGYHQSNSKLHRIKAGEFVLGYPNEYDLYTTRPAVAGGSIGADLLAPDVEQAGVRDFGRNGTYLALRQLRQDVVLFRATLNRLTQFPDGSSNLKARDHLAAQMVGRWPSGAPLIKSPWQDESALANENEFGYHAEDPAGLICPLGAHIRRANPRDALAPNPGTEDSLNVNRKHRILRRGRIYGPELPLGEVDTVDRGLMFVGVGANLARQFEFIQHSWLFDPRFNGFSGESDPIVGPSAQNTFSVQATPLRCRYAGIPRFVQVLGGGYFFLPSIRALTYLAHQGE